MHGCGLLLVVDVEFEREIYLGLPLTGIDRAFHDTHQGDLLLFDAQTPSRQCGVVFRIGCLLGRKLQGQTLWHKLVCIKMSYKDSVFYYNYL